MKVNVKELRIGNLIYDSNHGICQVGCLDIRSNDLGLINEYGGSHLGTSIYFIKPIPLTEEWLVRFGFGLSKSDFDYSDGMDQRNYVINNSLKGKLSDFFRVYWRNEKMITWVEEIWPSKLNDKGSNFFVYVTQEYVMSIKYVHQLQNLYFALTGEELVIGSTAENKEGE